jgi:hypothetical protein
MANPENGAKFGLERRAERAKERAKRKAKLFVFGALSFVLSLDEQRKNKKQITIRSFWFFSMKTPFLPYFLFGKRTETAQQGARRWQSIIKV